MIKWTSSNLLDLFSGVFKRARYSSDLPPQKQFPNHESCRKFSDFISREIINRISTGAFRLWGEVGVDDPPFLVLPLTVQTKTLHQCQISESLDEIYADLS